MEEVSTLILTVSIFTVAGIFCASRPPAEKCAAGAVSERTFADTMLDADYCRRGYRYGICRSGGESGIGKFSCTAVYPDAGGRNGKGDASSSETGRSVSDQADKGSDRTNAAQIIGETSFTTYKPVKVKSKYYESTGRIAHTTVYPYQTVGNDYFADAVFIGDSRMLGLHDYAGWQDHADFFCDNGFSVYKWAKDAEAVNQKNGKTVNLQKALSAKKYGKIYLMVGMNDLGYGTTDLYTANMQKMLTILRSSASRMQLFT